MNRRKFFKGFFAVTGTLAIAPGIALAPVESVKSSLFIDELIVQQQLINRMMTHMDFIIANMKPTVTPLDTLLAHLPNK